MNKDEQNGKINAKPEEVCPGKKDKLVHLQAEIEKKNSPEMWRSLE